MWLQSVFPPDAMYCRATYPLRMGHHPNTPMGSVLRPSPKGGFHDGSYLLPGDLLRPTGAGVILQDSTQAFILVASAPEENSWKCRGQLAGKSFVGHAFGRSQDDLDA